MRIRALAMSVLLASPVAALAESSLLAPPPPPPPTPFDQGRVSVTAGGGARSNFGETRFSLGFGAGYFVVDGLELGLGSVYTFGGGPSIVQLTPSVRYFLQPLAQHSPILPYVGAFYNHYFVSNEVPDFDSLGGRAGLVYVSGNFMIGGGVVAERFLNECDDCTDVYPDFVLALVF